MLCVCILCMLASMNCPLFPTLRISRSSPFLFRQIVFEFVRWNFSRNVNVSEFVTLRIGKKVSDSDTFFRVLRFRHFYISFWQFLILKHSYLDIFLFLHFPMLAFPVLTLSYSDTIFVPPFLFSPPLSFPTDRTVANFCPS